MSGFAILCVTALVEVVLLGLLYCSLDISKREDRSARHKEKQINPFSDVEITVSRF